MEDKIKYVLFQCRTIQPFRISCGGKSSWRSYEFGDNSLWNLREILDNEIVIEFDFLNIDKNWLAINFTAINLLKAGFSFEIFDHDGRCPHIHLRNLPINFLQGKRLREFKRFFIKKFVPKEFLDKVDYSLCGTHLIALEFAQHWKNTYGIKQLLHKFTPIQRKTGIYYGVSTSNPPKIAV